MQSWSSILYGNDVLVISPTGTGKTLAYCLPIVIHILSRLNHCYDHDHHHDKIQNNSSDSSSTDNNSSWNGIDDNKNKKRKYPSSAPASHNFLSPMALILLPTRELAIQVYSIIKSFKYHFKITSGIVYGGHDKIQQIEKLRSACYINNYRNSSNGGSSSSSSNSSCNMGLHILVATPGRLIDFIQSNNNSTNDNDDELSTMMIDISNVSYLVIDEADRMLNLGFIEQLEKIFFHLSSYDKRQSLLFSATFLGKLNHIIEKYLKNPVIIRCNAMEFHDRSRVKNNNDNDDNCNNVDGTENDNNNNNNNSIIHDVNDNTLISNKNHGYNIDDDKRSNSNYILDNSNYNANADDDKNDQNNNDDQSRSSNKTVHFDETNNNNNDNKTSSLTISPSIQQKIHVCASHKKPRLLIKYILQCRNHEKINKVRQVGSMLIFTNKIKTLKFLSEFLGNGVINV